MIKENIKERIKNLIKRPILDKIIKFLDLSDIIVLTGMRQTGKTSLLYLTIDYLLKKIGESNIFYFSLDDPFILSSFNKNIKELEIYLNNQKTDKNKKIYLLIDEIQYLENPTSFLKYYYDNFPAYKFIVSGSSSFEIKKKFKDSLAGRKKIININPLSFKEFLFFKNKEINVNPSEQEKEELKRELDEYLIFGGHPKVVKAKEEETKKEELKDIYSSYLMKDIRDIGRIENIDGYNSLIQLLSSKIGNLLNIFELSNTLNINQITLSKYIFLLQNSFVLYFLKPYFKNKRKEISKMPKIYFNDLGLRNIAISDFRKISLRNDSGQLAENFVFNELKNNLKIGEEIFFWRTLNKQEVDFALKKDNQIIPIEVKYKSFKKNEINLGMKKFIENYLPQRAFIITKDYLSRETFKKCEINFIPIYLLDKITL